ncbi:hypothetical protein IP70_23815 [alpha proteobacterium AAP38]|nr:hypothetical protein IP70_23815 [alpha proteobacterium AAP38]
MSQRFIVAATLASAAVLWPTGYAASATPDEKPGLTVGVGKSDITPPKAELPPGMMIRDPLGARAILVRSGMTCAVLVGVDQGGTTNAVMDLALPEVRKITGCPESSIIVSATHTHSGSAMGPDGDPKRVATGIIAAVTQAAASQQPVRIGFGKVDVDLNSNRDFYDHKQRWVQANNPEGPSDKEMSVVGFIASDGRPIALYLNYAMHPVNFFMSGVISADFAGGASRFLEGRYGADTVAIFAEGAAGDQNPRLLGLPNQLIMAALNAPPIDERVGAPPPWESGPGSGAPPQPGTRDPQRYNAAYAEVSAGVDAMSWVIGQSAARLLRSPEFQLMESADIHSVQTRITCPGRVPKGHPIMPGGINETPEYADADPIEIKLGMLRIGDVHFGSVNAEVYNEIGMRLKRQAPVSKLMIVTLANGLAASGYIYSDAASERRTFQVLSSRLKPGCAEDKIVEANLKMISDIQR